MTHSLNADDEAERRLITTIINVAARHRIIALHAPSLMSAKLRVSIILRASSAATRVNRCYSGASTVVHISVVAEAS
ncbi:MAG: hypothetical protein M3545_12245 [Acidobacteriota bacterium]|nr:hypothetical protein [Acidobacteriota bacterium]